MSEHEISIPTSSAPPDEQLRTAYRIVRTPSSGELQGLILSNEIYGTWTHFFNGRTRPHTEPCCEACDAGQNQRWQGYLAVLLTRARDLVLFEFTAPASAPLVEYQEHNRGLRGAVMRAYRNSPRPNARVTIRLERGDIDMYSPPPAPNIAEILSRIWSIDRLIAHEAARAAGNGQARTANPQIPDTGPKPKRGRK